MLHFLMGGGTKNMGVNDILRYHFFTEVPFFYGRPRFLPMLPENEATAPKIQPKYGKLRQHSPFFSRNHDNMRAGGPKCDGGGKH